MREILFRGRRPDDWKWFEGDLIRERWGDFIQHHIVNVRCKDKVDPATVGQYTGLKDKNRKRIFEGDIVNIRCEIDQIGIISWDNDTARFVISADGIEFDFDNFYGSDLEVIGNIHDNPELLKEVGHES